MISARLSSKLASLEKLLATISFALSPSARYFAAVLLVALALAIRLLIAPIGPAVPFITFFPAAAMSAILGGLGPGLLSAGLGAVIASFLFISFGDSSGILSVAIFLIDGVIVCTAIEAMRRYYRRSAEAAQNLEITIQRLTTINAELERFAYVASHDLQEPLRSITSFSQLIARDYTDRLDARGQEFLGFVIDGGKRMHGLINDLLSYSRISSHASLRQWVKAADAVQTALDDLTDAIHESGAEIVVGSLPLVWANDVQLAELFRHLVGNAIKFRAPGRPLVISVTSKRDGDDWVFNVNDNGIGFAPMKSDVFEIFRQLHPRGTYAGQGVGLALCKRIVQDHEGRIWANSVPEQGSAFSISLPARENRMRACGAGGH
ncbi:MAG: DUF4118 domain-containing protein [Rhizobiales bacterium]|nr:DUF4118 domain-containing protein [Hyphomicrobiales bacterium]